MRFLASGPLSPAELFMDGDAQRAMRAIERAAFAGPDRARLDAWAPETVEATVVTGDHSAAHFTPRRRRRRTGPIRRCVMDMR